MAKRGVRGQGYSLYGLQTEISQAVDLLTEALERQGVSVNPDSLLLRIQNVVNDVGNGVAALDQSASSYSYLQASEDEEVPYSVAGDLLAIAYEKFKIGQKRDAVKNVISAMEYEDFGDITMGLLAMNMKSSQQVTASEKEDTDIDESDELEDEDDNEEEEDDDISDDDIDALLEDDTDSVEASDEDENKDSDEDEDGKEEEEVKPEPTKEKPKDKPAPTTKSPMSEESPITASLAQKSISNKLSMSGDTAGRGKGLEFLKKAGANRAA